MSGRTRERRLSGSRRPGAYSADRSYGCDQSSIGHDGYPGTVTVVFENDSQHCTATFPGTTSGPRPQYGPEPVCALGGYIPLPVPLRLLQLYSKVDEQLTVLVREVQRGTLTNRHGALDGAVAAVVLPQSDAFGSLFPPVWGWITVAAASTPKIRPFT